MGISNKKAIAIIGGGASGIFASLRCAEVAKAKKINVDIRVFEEIGQRRTIKKNTNIQLDTRRLNRMC